jgi:MFS family permease
MPARRNHNFIVHLLNGVFMAIADVLLDPGLIVTALLSQLTTSNLLIGLLAPLRDTGWFLPQLFVSHFVARAPRKIVFYQWTTLIRIVGLCAITLSLFLISDHRVLLWAFFIGMTLLSLASGVGGLSYLTVTAKVIAPGERGRLFGLREFIGGVCAVLMGGVSALILGGGIGGLQLDFPRNFGAVFAIATLFFAIGTTLFGLLKEPPDPPTTEHRTLRAQLGDALGVLRGGGDMPHYITMRMALLFARSGVPFMTVYAKRFLGVSDGAIAAMVTVGLVFGLSTGPLWGRLNDRRGARFVLALATATGISVCLCAMLMTRLPPAAAFWTWVVAMVLAAIGSTGFNVSTLPLLIDVAPPGQQPLYFGLNSTVLGVTMLGTSVIGLLGDLLGFVPLFAVCAGFFVLALNRLRCITGAAANRLHPAAA